MKPRRRSSGFIARRLLAALGILLVSIGLVYAALHLLTPYSTFARAVVWRDADVDDYKRFPSRSIAASPHPARFLRKSRAGAARTQITIGSKGRSVALDEFLAETGTTAFVVLSDDAVVYEDYFNGSTSTSIQTSFSVAKSFLSALVGIAIAENRIAGVDDPVTQYVPELADRDSRFRRITLRHLLTMESGLRYNEQGLPWSDDARTYYGTDLRSIAIEDTEVVELSGSRFHYNNYNALLIGLVLERVLPMSVSEYLETRLWRPMGAEAGASWSMDSEGSGFEKMESGLNARAIDFARFGLLYLRHGRRNSRQLIPEAWVTESTRAANGRDPSSAYQYFWWVDDERGAPDDFYARGNHGQFIYISPARNVVIVRFGKRFGFEQWPALLDELAGRFGRST